MAPVPISAFKVGHIDDVQELRKGKSSHVPERFIRDTTERPALEKAISCSDNIPVIDLSKLAKGSRDEFCNELHRLMNSCQEWGFFQVIMCCPSPQTFPFFLYL